MSNIFRDSESLGKSNGKKIHFCVFLVHPTMLLVLLSASDERCFVSRIRDFFFIPTPITLNQWKFPIDISEEGQVSENLLQFGWIGRFFSSGSVTQTWRSRGCSTKTIVTH
jgi:hypothetical protein